MKESGTAFLWTMIPKESNTGLVAIVVDFLGEGAAVCPISAGAAAVTGGVNSAPQLERSPPKRTTITVVTVLQVLIDVLFTGLSLYALNLEIRQLSIGDNLGNT